MLDWVTQHVARVPAGPVYLAVFTVCGLLIAAWAGWMERRERQRERAIAAKRKADPTRRRP